MTCDAREDDRLDPDNLERARSSVDGLGVAYEVAERVGESLLLPGEESARCGVLVLGLFVEDPNAGDEGREPLSQMGLRFCEMGIVIKECITWDNGAASGDGEVGGRSP